VTRAAAAIVAAYGNHPHSISRLHDDELACMLSFLSLTDLAQLVCCSRRFNGVARRERSRELAATPVVGSIPPLLRSSLSHHVASVRLEKRDSTAAHITRTTLVPLRSLPQLTKLHVRVSSDAAAAVLLHGTSAAADAAETLQATLPTSLRSFSFFTYPGWVETTAHLRQLASALLAAATTMHQLTELRIEHIASWADMRLDALCALPLLRNLKLISANFVIPVLGVKQLSQLRELELELVRSADLVSLCQPPHSLQLETLRVDLEIGEVEMRALLHLPSLTHVEPRLFHRDAWPLLPQLPHLRRLNLRAKAWFTDESTSMLSAALTLCTALDDLTLTVVFPPVVGGDPPEEEQRPRWSALLHSVPQLTRLEVLTGFAAPLFAVLPAHLPQLQSPLPPCDTQGAQPRLAYRSCHPQHSDADTLLAQSSCSIVAAVPARYVGRTYHSRDIATAALVAPADEPRCPCPHRQRSCGARAGRLSGCCCCTASILAAHFIALILVHSASTGGLDAEFEVGDTEPGFSGRGGQHAPAHGARHH
jgi:hypothetical protein